MCFVCVFVCLSFFSQGEEGDSRPAEKRLRRPRDSRFPPKRDGRFSPAIGAHVTRRSHLPSLPSAPPPSNARRPEPRAERGSFSRSQGDWACASSRGGETIVAESPASLGHNSLAVTPSPPQAAQKPPGRLEGGAADPLVGRGSRTGKGLGQGQPSHSWRRESPGSPLYARASQGATKAHPPKGTFWARRENGLPASLSAGRGSGWRLLTRSMRRPPPAQTIWLLSGRPYIPPGGALATGLAERHCACSAPGLLSEKGWL